MAALETLVAVYWSKPVGLFCCCAPLQAAGVLWLLCTAVAPDVSSKGSPSWRAAVRLVIAVQQVPVLISKLKKQNKTKKPTV